MESGMKQKKNKRKHTRRNESSDTSVECIHLSVVFYSLTLSVTPALFFRSSHASYHLVILMFALRIYV